MPHERVLQYEFFLDNTPDGVNERFVVRAYLTKRVLRNFPWQTRVAIERYITGRAWFEDFLPRRVSAWLLAQTKRFTASEFRDAMREYLCHYLKESDDLEHPLGVESRQRQFLVANAEDRFVLSLLLAAKNPAAIYVFGANYIMAPTQIFLLSAE
jgi:hypothetical protein